MSESKTGQSASPRWLTWLVLLILLGVGLALRWRYIQEISLFIDEFVTAWAARNVLNRGLPVFPSGNFYPHGFVFTYLEVPFVLGQFDETLARIPGLLVSLATIPLAYWVGKRLFGDRAGLIAAAALAVDPDCILWGGRARMYGLLQLLTLLVVYTYYRGLVEDRPRYRYLALGLTIVAIFTHAEAVLLLPALGLATLVAWPWRQVLRRDVFLPFVIGALGAGAFFLISKFGQPGHLETLQESRPYLAFSGDVLGGPLVFAPAFIDPHRLPATLLTLAGLILLFRPRFDRRSPLTYLYVIFVSILAPLLVLAGATWQNERYLFLLLPILYLIGGAVLVRLLDMVPALDRTRPWQPAALALLVILYIGLTGSRQAYQPEWGYDRAFRFLRDQAQPQVGDRILSVSPSACALYLEECDYFAIQRGYEEFLVPRPGDGLPADLWTATPVLTDTAQFVELLDSAPRLWLVTDGWRFQTRFQASFIQAVLDRMEVAYDDLGVIVWRSKADPPPEPAVQHPRQARFDQALALAGFDLSTARPQPGDELEVTLYWQALEDAGVAYTAFLHLIDADENGMAGVDQEVLQEYYQPALWPRDATMADRHRLPIPDDLAPGHYRLDLGLYPAGQPGDLLPVEGGDRLPLATLTVGEPAELPPPSVPAGVDFGGHDGQIRLVGYDLERAVQDSKRAIAPILHWKSLQPTGRDYTVFAHLLDSDGAIVAQDDAPPGDPFFPTSTWLPGAVVLDPHVLVLPDDAPAGEYTILVGLYHAPTDQRLEATGPEGEPLGDAYQLGPISLGEDSP